MQRGLFVVGATLLAALAFAAGARWSDRAGAVARAPSGPRYLCPMHPQYLSDRPGDCVSCGMRLEPMRADASSGVTAGPTQRPGTVRVSAERQQAIGVRLGLVDRVGGTRSLRTSGRVAADENATYQLVAGTSGWIRSVGNATTGARVRRHERLAAFYSPEFIVAQQSWYTGLDSFDRVATHQVVATFNDNRIADNVQRYADTLRNMGVSEVQLAEMRRDRAMVQDIYVTSPVDGFVLQRNVSAGLRFDRGFEFYRVADLRRVWVQADLYQHQQRFVRPGMAASLRTQQQARTLPATVSRAEPVFDQDTLTLKVRLEADNPGFALKPGMFVDVEFHVDLPPTIAVPADAIVDYGTRKTVFVELGDGYFEPRQVETGWRIGEQVEILGGLVPGERIVLSGTFLIDSESRLRAAAGGGQKTAATDPVCGMEVTDVRDATTAGRTSTHGGATYYFCADVCKKRFDANPGGFTSTVTSPVH